MDEFIAWNRRGTFGEGGIGDLLSDLGAYGGNEFKEALCGDVVEFAFCEFSFNAGKVVGKGFPAFVSGFENTLGQGLGFGGAEVLNLELVLASPVDERGLGDVEFDADTVVAPALGA